MGTYAPASRPQPLPLVALTALAMALQLLLLLSPATAPPNVLIILTDDQVPASPLSPKPHPTPAGRLRQGWGDTGYNCGQPGSVAYSQRNLTACPHTPHIDALATGPHSVLFHRFYSGPQSQPHSPTLLPRRCCFGRCWLAADCLSAAGSG